MSVNLTPAALPEEDQDDLTPEEEKALRARRRLYWLIPLIVVLLVWIGFAARPASRLIKAWHARRLAAEVSQLIDQKEWNQANGKARDAYQLSPTEPEAWRAIARLLSRTGQGVGALEWWKKLEKAPRPVLTPEDRQDYAAAALAAGELPLAGEQIGRLAAENPQPPPAIALLQSRLAAQRGEGHRAVDGAERVLGDARSQPPDVLTAARLILTLVPADSPAYATAFGALLALARSDKPSGESLEALTLLARQPMPISSGQVFLNTEVSPAVSSEELGKALESHPLARPYHQMLAWELRVRAHPEELPRLVAEGLQRFATPDGKDDEGLAAFARWLHAQGQLEAVLQAIPPKRAESKGALCLLRLDALGMLGRWAEVEEALKQMDFLLDPLVQQMYLAAATAQLGQDAASANAWDRALTAAHEDAAKCLQLATYADRLGALEVAAKASQRAIELAPRTRPAWNLLLKVAESRRDSTAAVAALEGVVRHWPEDSVAAKDLAFLRLLRGDTQGDEIKVAAHLAETSLLTQSNNWQDKTMLALARLRLDRPAEAMAAFGIQPADASTLDSAPPGARAIWAAVLAANGWQEDAAAQAAALSGTLLWPEERALIAGLR